MGRSRKKQSNKLGVICITFVVLFVMLLVRFQINKSSQELEDLEEEAAYYNELLQQEKERTLELEDKRLYVKTKAYVEETAKKLGLVYPDEIIYKPKD